MRGSWPHLLLFGGVFLAGFAGLRARSTVLAVERRAPELRELARRHGLTPAAVLALRAGAPQLDDGAFAARVAVFARLRAELGEPLAAVAVAGGEDQARAAVAAAGGDVAVAWAAFRGDPVALPGVGFELLCARFAARDSGRSP